jgi:predicted amidophosphoribosyltransferase
MSDFAKCMKLISGDTYCVQCGIPIKQTSNRKKYCSSCWKDKQLQWQREAWHKYKDKYRPAKVLENP